MPSMAAPSCWLMPDMPWQPPMSQSEVTACYEMEMLQHKQSLAKNTDAKAAATATPPTTPATPAASAASAAAAATTPLTTASTASSSSPSSAATGVEGPSSAPPAAAGIAEPAEAAEPAAAAAVAPAAEVSEAPACDDAEAAAVESTQAEEAESPIASSSASPVMAAADPLEASTASSVEVPAEASASAGEAVLVTKGKRKTKLCRLWEEGRCRRRRCPFAHGAEELRIHHTDDAAVATAAAAAAACAPTEVAPVAATMPTVAPVAAAVEPVMSPAPAAAPAPEAAPQQQQPQQPAGPWAKYSIYVPDAGTGEEPVEAACLGAYLAPNTAQRGHRCSIRDTVHHFVTEHIDRNAITKVAGASAACVDFFDTRLDLVVDASEAEQYAGEHVSRLCSVLSSAGVMSTIIPDACVPTLSLDSCAMSAVHQKWAKSYFKVSITFCHGGYSPERREFSVVQASLMRAKTQKVLIPAITGVIRSHASGAALPDRAVLVLCLAFFEHAKTHFQYEDLSWVFTEFFTFYSTFNFAKHAVRVADLPFPKKSAEVREICVSSVVSEENITSGSDYNTVVSMLKELAAHFQAGGAIQDVVSSSLVRSRDAVLYECTSPDYAAKQNELVSCLASLSTLLADPANQVHRATVRTTLLHFHPALPSSRTVPKHEQNAVQVKAQELYESLFEPE
eukprot:Rhum_TRINITY_DN14266_c11_g1::Rhum_TRINITY_DN14266_c11_g1_i1::g.78941::m.78941